MKTLSDFGLTETNLTLLTILFVAFFLVTTLIAAALFYIEAYGVYRMSRKLSIKGAWRNFVPVIRVFSFGELAASASSLNNKKRAYKNLIVAIYFLKLIFAAVFILFFIKDAVKLIFAADLAAVNGTALNPKIFSDFTLTAGFFLIYLGITAIFRIVVCSSLVQIFKQFLVKNSTILSVICFFIPIVFPFVLVSVCKKSPIKKENGNVIDDRVGFK